MKICLYLCLHLKIICSRIHIKTPFNFWDMRTWLDLFELWRYSNYRKFKLERGNCNFFRIKFYKKVYFQRKFITRLCCFFFLLSYMFPWMSKFVFTGSNFLPRLIHRKLKVLYVAYSLTDITSSYQKNKP